MTRWLIQPPTDRGGSRGDEALIRGALSVVPDAKVHVPAEWVSTWPADLPFDTGPKMAEYTHMALIGADCVDGAYGDPPIEMLWSAWGSKVQCRVISFSLGETSDRAVIDRLRGLRHAGVRFIARDTVSQQRFAARVGRACDLGGDLALLTPKGRCREGHGAVVIFPTMRALEAGALEPTVKAARLADRTIWIVPHDPRHDDENACHAVESALLGYPHEVRRWPLRSVGAIRGLVANADLIISHRLHPCLLAIAEGTPAVALGYGGKFEGAFADLGIDWLQTDSPELLPVLVLGAVEELDTWRTRARDGAAVMAARARASLEVSA